MMKTSVAIATDKTSGRNYLRRKLARHIMSLKPGQAMPPIRDLTQTLQTSRRRIEDVLCEFDEGGLIERRARSGIFKSEKATNADAVPIIDVVDWGRGESFDNRSLESEQDFFAHLFRALAARLGENYQSVRVHHFDNSTSDFPMLVNRHDMHACILVHHPPGRDDVFEYLNAHGVSWVALYPQSIEARDRFVLPPRGDLIAKQLEHLWSLGHERIAFFDQLGPNPANNVLLLRREAFYRLMAERGLRVCPHWVPYYADYTQESTKKAMDTVFSQPEHPTALIVADPQLITIYRCLDERSIKIGKDISIIATDGLPVTESLYPRVTTTFHSRQKASQLAIEALETVLMGRAEPKAKYVPIELVVRESTQRVSKSR